MPGNLDNSKTTKAVTGDEDRVVTYEITLHNTGEALSGVNVTDQLPAGMTLTNVSVAPTSATTSLQSNQTSFTWIGAVAQSSEVVLTVTAQVDAEATTVAENTVQINDGQIFTRSSTALQFETPFKYIFLPLLMRGS
jgi:uncharacterized repeat protein (TIGR01451 family)